MYNMVNKPKQINSRLSEDQIAVLQQIVDEGKAKTQSGAIQYLINQYGILNPRK